MKKFIVILAFLSSINVIAQSERPKLVVGIVVDQMRQDYIYRYWDTYGNNGFKRLINDGFMLKNAHYHYIPTNTGPGHAAIYTGTTPTYNGVISNSWYDPTENAMVNCVGDNNVETLGADNDRGHASPHRLISSTITDELKLASQSRSKVISVSIKDRGSILPAGHMADGAFWYDEETGNFVSSTYYMEKLPKWVDKFNKRKLTQEYLTQTWDLLLDKSMYKASGPDESHFEQVFGDKPFSKFPFNMSEMGRIAFSPFGNQIVLEMALAAYDSEKLGQGNETDFLAISFSSPDYAGHIWGPNSLEVQDMYLRLDKNIADLLAKLDETIGEGEYLVFLTSDHGAVDVPARLDSLKVPAGYTRINVAKELNDYLIKQLGTPAQYLKNVSNNQVFFDHSQLSGDELSVASRLAANYLRHREGIFLAYTSEEMRTTDFNAGGQLGMLTRGYNQTRSGDVLYSLKPGFSSSGSTKGTGHGTGFTYDTHVPILFYGKGINIGSSAEYYTVTDIAPTLSVLLNIRFPNAATGQPITEVIK